MRSFARSGDPTRRPTGATTWWCSDVRRKDASVDRAPLGDTDLRRRRLRPLATAGRGRRRCGRARSRHGDDAGLVIRRRRRGRARRRRAGRGRKLRRALWARARRVVGRRHRVAAERSRDLGCTEVEHEQNTEHGDGAQGSAHAISPENPRHPRSPGAPPPLIALHAAVRTAPTAVSSGPSASRWRPVRRAGHGFGFADGSSRGRAHHVRAGGRPSSPRSASASSKPSRAS